MRKAKIKGEKVAFIPYGTFIHNTAYLHSNSYTPLENLKKIIDSEGLLVLDAHLTRTDIFASIAMLVDNLPFEKMVIPVASTGYFLPGINNAYEKLNGSATFEFYPVFRKEDRIPNLRNWLSWRFFHKNLNPEEMNRYNQKYIDASLKALATPKNVVLLAPFGDTSTFGEQIRYGVQKLMKTGVPVICTYSFFNNTELQYCVAISNPLRFSQDSVEPEMRNQINEVFRELFEVRKAHKPSHLPTKLLKNYFTFSFYFEFFNVW